MGRLTWGVDGYGLCHVVDGNNNIIYCAFNSGGASIFCKDFYMKKPLSIKEDSVFKVVFRNTEYIFETMENAQLFKMGFLDSINGSEKKYAESHDYNKGFEMGAHLKDVYEN